MKKKPPSLPNVLLPSELKKLEGLLYWGQFAPSNTVGEHNKRNYIHSAWKMVLQVMKNLEMPEPEHKMPKWMYED